MVSDGTGVVSGAWGSLSDGTPRQAAESQAAAQFTLSFGTPRNSGRYIQGKSSDLNESSLDKPLQTCPEDYRTMCRAGCALPWVTPSWVTLSRWKDPALCTNKQTPDIGSNSMPGLSHSYQDTQQNMVKWKTTNTICWTHWTLRT